MRNDWRQRLADAQTKSGLSKRSVSLKSGLGPGYLHSILTEGKDPGVESLLAVCNTIGVSLSSILYGVEIGPADEQLLALIQNSDPEKRIAMINLLSDKAAR